MEEFRREFMKNTEKCIIQTFPEIILHLNKILENPDFSISGTVNANFKLDVPMEVLRKRHAMHVEGRKNVSEKGLIAMTKKIDADLGILPNHKTIQEMLAIINPFYHQLIKDTGSLKLWLSFLTPKTEDGNNFGVQVQERMHLIVCNAERLNKVLFENATIYNNKRSKLCTKLVKYPYVEDFIQAIDMLDEHYHLYLAYLLHLIRDCYLSINDLFVKNWEKIIDPKDSNALSLY